MVARDGDTVRVLGVDPGLTRCGHRASWTARRAARPVLVARRLILHAAASADIAARLLALEEEIDTWLAGVPARLRSRWSGCSASTTCGR